MIMTLPHKKHYNHMVYKYYPFNDNTKDALSKNYLFFSKASKLNDPYDTSSMLLTDEFYENLTKIYRNAKLPKDLQIPFLKKTFKVMDNYGICSFSKSEDNMHLWALYADKFSGIVVGFDEEELKDLSYHNGIIPLMNTEYVKNWPRSYKSDTFNYSFYNGEHQTYQIRHCFEGNESGRILEYFFHYLCTVKSNSWKEEKEVRLVASYRFLQELNKKHLYNVEKTDVGYKVPFPLNAVKCIIIGHNFIGGRTDIKKIARKYGITEIFKTSCKMPFKIDIVKHDELTNYVNR